MQNGEEEEKEQMDRYFNWLESLAPLPRWLALLASALVGLAAVGAITVFVMSGQSNEEDKIPQKDRLRFLLILPVYLVALGTVVCLSLAVILGPYITLQSRFHWSISLSMLIGLPVGPLMFVGIWMAVMTFMERRTGKKT